MQVEQGSGRSSLDGAERFNRSYTNPRRLAIMPARFPGARSRCDRVMNYRPRFHGNFRCSRGL